MESAARRRYPVASAVFTGTIVGLVFIVSAPATAEPTVLTDESTGVVVRHPELDWAGSQVARHEPVTSNKPMDAPMHGLLGLDVSSHQGDVDWTSVAQQGARFAYVKATEGVNYTNPYFAQQYDGSAKAGLIHGAYHFATPDTSSGAAQADYFIAHGGGWTDDGKTLPGMVDLEWNPYGPTCYGLSPESMVSWIHAFNNEYHTKTGRWPVIYTATRWWSTCTGDTDDVSDTNPLMLARYAGDPGPMPYKWDYQAIWQYADAGPFPGDQDLFNGDESQLSALASG